jgi:UDP-GlcNAc3NAcA epimerase
VIKIVTIIGARPQIIKAAALSRAIKNNYAHQIQEIIIHTGQHYDTNMSAVFFDELGIPQPNYNLNVGSGAHGEQTAKMIIGIEEILIKEQPQAIVVYGDTNSTLAGAIAASKIHIPIVHIEAGLRSFNKKMPEEINRILCDHTSTLLFTPTKAGLENLINEGFSLQNKAPYTSDQQGIFHCGDIMYDNSLHFSNLSDQKSSVLNSNNLTAEKYILTTIHRNDNTDSTVHLSSIFESLLNIIKENGIDIILPLHPRTLKLIAKNLSTDLQVKIKSSQRLKIIEPVSFLDMIELEKNAFLIITDSGGVQKEAYFFKKPCIILRPETEWVELVECGAAIIVGSDSQKIDQAYTHFQSTTLQFQPIFGDGKAAEFICDKMIENFSNQ